MELVQNKYVYWDFIRKLRNLDGVREGFIEQEIISEEDHESYMKENSSFFYICLDKSIPIGYIGIIENDIRVATHPDYQGKGVASFMVNEIMKINKNAVAKVKIDNIPSLKLFERCGFEKKYYLLEKK
jgi:RimJ/RimL family protein N-acetyltransferase